MLKSPDHLWFRDLVIVRNKKFVPWTARLKRAWRALWEKEEVEIVQQYEGPTVQILFKDRNNARLVYENNLISETFLVDCRIERPWENLQ